MDSTTTTTDTKLPATREPWTNDATLPEKMFYILLVLIIRFCEAVHLTGEVLWCGVLALFHARGQRLVNLAFIALSLALSFEMMAQTYPRNPTFVFIGGVARILGFAGAQFILKICWILLSGVSGRLEAPPAAAGTTQKTD